MSMVYGVDVSHHVNPDFEGLANGGVRFCYGKATEGAKWVDPKFYEYKKKAEAAGMLWGSYHYLSWDVPFMAQVDNFIRTAVDPFHGLEGQLSPALDVEGDEHGNIGGLSPAQYTEMAVDWLAEISNKFGISPLVYTYFSFAENRLKPERLLKQWRLWASWTGNPPNKPAVPGTIKPFPGWGENWTIHQYSTAGLDRNVIKDEATLQSLIVKPKTIPIKVVDHATGKLLQTLQMVPNGNHIPDLKKIFVRGEQ